MALPWALRPFGRVRTPPPPPHQGPAGKEWGGDALYALYQASWPRHHQGGREGGPREEQSHQLLRGWGGPRGSAGTERLGRPLERRYEGSTTLR